MTEPKPHYTIHNFDAINEYVASMAARHQTTISRSRAEVFSTYAKYFAVLSVAGGITAALIMWGYWLLKKKPDPKIITTEKIIERPIKIEPQIIVSGTGSTSQANDVRRRAEGQVTALSGSASESTGGKNPPITPVYNFTIFKEIPFNRDGIDEVIVGMAYDDSESKIPSSQWCYITIPNLDGTATRLNLASKSPAFGRKEQSLTYAQASEMGTTISILRSAQDLCAFE